MGSSSYLVYLVHLFVMVVDTWFVAAYFSHLTVIPLDFQGIVRAIRDYQGPLKEHEVTIFVRRGGPNYQEGLRVMGEVGKMRTFLSLLS